MKLYAGKHTYPIVLAVIAAAILVAGFLLKPSPQKAKSKTEYNFTTIMGEVSRLREIAQRNSFRSTSARFNAAANDAAQHALRLIPSNRPAWVIGDDGTFVTAGPSEAAPTLRVLQGGDSVPVNLLTWGAGLPFTIARVSSPIAGMAATSVPSNQINPGAWILLVSFNSSGVVFSPGSYGGQAERSCGLRQYPVLLSNIPLDANSVGAGLFDFDGNLLAIVVRCDQGPAAIPLDALRAAAASESESLPMLQLGFLAAEVNPTWIPLLRQSSRIVITDLWQAWPAANSGLNAGDVVVSVNGEPVQTVDQVVSLIGNGTGNVEFGIQKGPRTIRAVIARNPPPASGVEFEGQMGAELRRVPEDSALARAGFRAGDQILSLNGARATSTNIASMLSGTALQHPALLVGQRGSRTFARAVTP